MLNSPQQKKPRPDQYGITQYDRGNSLESIAIISCLKGKFKKNQIIFKFNHGYESQGKPWLSLTPTLRSRLVITST